MCACNLTLSQRNRLKVLYLLSIIVVQNKKDFVIKKKGMCVFNITRIKQIIKKLEKCNTKWHYSYALYSFKTNLPNMTALLLLLLSRFSRVRLCATPETAAHQAPPSLGFSRQEHWSGLPFPSPMHESEKWKWSRLVVSDSSQPHGLQPTRLLCPWDFPGKSTGVGCHCLLQWQC